MSRTQNLNSLLNNIESKLSNGAKGYYETKIKEDLPYYKEQKYKELADKFKPSNTSYGLSSEKTFDTTKPLNLTEPITVSMTTHPEIRKMMEVEMEPYLFKMQSELNLQMLNFKNEISDYLQFKEEIDLLREKNQKLEKLIQTTEEANAKENLDNNKQVLVVSKKLRELETALDNLTKTQNKNTSAVREALTEIPNIKSMNERISTIELSNESVLKEIEKSLQNDIDLKYQSFTTQVDSVKRMGDSLSKNVSSLMVSVSSMDNILKQNEIYKDTLIRASNEQKEDINKLSAHIQNAINQYDLLKKNVETVDGKISLVNQELNETKVKIDTLQLGFNTIGNDFVNNTKKFDEAIQHFDTLKTAFESIKNEFDNMIVRSRAQDEKIVGLTNDMIQLKESLAIKQLNDKIVKCQFALDQLTDYTNGKITSINTNLAQIIQYLDSSTARGGQLSSGVSARQAEEQNKFNTIFEKTVSQLAKEHQKLKDLVNVHEEKLKGLQGGQGSQEGQGNVFHENPADLNSSISVIKDNINILSQNYKMLKEDVDNNFEKLGKWQDEIQGKMISFTINNAHRIDSTQRSGVGVSEDVYNKLAEVEEKLMTQSRNIENFSRQFANKNHTEARLAIIEKQLNNFETTKMPELYSFIENKINSLLMSSQPNTSNRQHNNYSDRPKLEINPETEYKDYSVNISPTGSVNNKGKDFILSGNMSGEQTNEFIQKPSKGLVFSSTDNRIDSSYPKVGETEKFSQNEGYQNSDYFEKTHPSNYLRKDPLPRNGEEIKIESVDVGTERGHNPGLANQDFTNKYDEIESYPKYKEKEDSENNSGYYPEVTPVPIEDANSEYKQKSKEKELNSLLGDDIYKDNNAIAPGDITQDENEKDDNDDNWDDDKD